MLNKVVHSVCRLMVLLAVLTVWNGCARLQQAAETVARSTGNEQVAHMIQGGGTLMRGLLPIGYEEEQSIGAAISLQVVARYGGVIEAPALTRYVNLVGGSVALTCDRPEIPYYFAVLNHDSINAFAAPAGYVFVTKGLLAHIQNEAELAAVLGHEIAHVTQKHILEVIQRNKALSGVAQAGLAYADQDPAAFQGVIDGAVKKLLDEGLDRDKETEADILGTVFARRVGYDPTAYLGLLQRLRTLKGDDQAFFKTHPNFSDRIDALQQEGQEREWKMTGVVVQDRFDTYRRGL